MVFSLQAVWRIYRVILRGPWRLIKGQKKAITMRVMAFLDFFAVLKLETFFQIRSGLKSHGSTGFNRDHRTGLRILALSRLARPDRKGPKAGHLETLVLADRFADMFKGCVYRVIGDSFVELGRFRHCLNEFSLCHSHSPPPSEKLLQHGKSEDAANEPR
jgi:hypothetical protein